MREVEIYQGRYILNENGEIWKVNKTTVNRRVNYTTSADGSLLFRSRFGCSRVIDLLGEHFVPKKDGCTTIVVIDSTKGLVASNLEWVDRSVGAEFIDNGIRAKVVSYDKAVREDGMITYLNKDLVYSGSVTSQGYLQVQIGNKQVRVHRLVAEAFLPKSTTNEAVDHINENKQDNRVSNLRWCTNKENTKYYTNMRENRLITELDRKSTELKLLQITVRNDKREIERLHNEVAYMQEELNDSVVKFEKYVTKENGKIATAKENYYGYADTKGHKFGSVENMVEEVGKRITVSGTLFSSCGSAAKWILEQEASIGVARNKDTISKELRRYLQGKRSTWTMYEKYTIGY